jgi:hypothetical protein
MSPEVEESWIAVTIALAKFSMVRRSGNARNPPSAATPARIDEDRGTQRR